MILSEAEKGEALLETLSAKGLASKDLTVQILAREDLAGKIAMAKKRMSDMNFRVSPEESSYARKLLERSNITPFAYSVDAETGESVSLYSTRDIANMFGRSAQWVEALCRSTDSRSAVLSEENGCLIFYKEKPTHKRATRKFTDAALVVIQRLLLGGE